MEKVHRLAVTWIMQIIFSSNTFLLSIEFFFILKKMKTPFLFHSSPCFLISMDCWRGLETTPGPPLPLLPKAWMLKENKAIWFGRFSLLCSPVKITMTYLNSIKSWNKAMPRQQAKNLPNDNRSIKSLQPGSWWYSNFRCVSSNIH